MHEEYMPSVWDCLKDTVLPGYTNTKSLLHGGKDVMKVPQRTRSVGVIEFLKSAMSKVADGESVELVSLMDFYLHFIFNCACLQYKLI